MIYTDSRYADGNVSSKYANRDSSYHLTILRNFPEESSRYTLYVWREQDRIDLVSATFYGDASRWWHIMDFNPEILNPMDIPVGTIVRLPGGQ